MINKKNIWKAEARISYLEIFILIMAMFAFAYIIRIKEIEKKEVKESMIFNFLKAWMKRSKVLSLVSAEDALTYNYEVFGGYARAASDAASTTCCLSLNNSAKCQNILASRCDIDCLGGCLPTKCELTSVCKLGCCVDEDEGTCAANTPRDSCTGTWIDDSACNNPACNNACCVIGSQSFFTTEKRCEKIASFYGMDKDFRKAISTEVACIALSYSQDEGACLIKTEKETGCRFTTKSECIGLTKDARNFHKGYLCSNPDLNTTCVKQARTGCVTGKDGVYWMDSCGNRENIYSANKEQSWNNGIVLPIDKSCNANAGSINSANCGNCDYFKGSICSKADSSTAKPTYGDYVCRDLNCHNAPDNVGVKDRKNGEAWCVYDSFIGEGKDTVGSRHWKYYCIDGEVKVEPCGDYRTGICVQSEENGINSAACRPNRAMECISYNSKEENQDTEKLKEDCEENSDCMIRNFNFGTGYKFSVCTPKYPPGFDMKDNAETAEKICNQASMTCTKVEIMEYTGWKCMAGCECNSDKFPQQMNDYCVSLGDCGSYVNILGEADDKGSRMNKEHISAEQYVKYASPVKGQFADPGDFSKLTEAAYGWGAANPIGWMPEDNTMLFGLGATGIGGIGALISGGTKVTAVQGLVGTYTAAMPTMLGAMGSALSAMAIGAGIGLMIAQFMGIQGQGAMGLAIGGALAGLGLTLALSGSVSAAFTSSGALAYAITYEAFINAGLPAAMAASEAANAALAASWIPVVGWILAILSAAFMIYTIAAGIGEVKETKYEFHCNPYEPPKGGSDCSKCDTDSKLTGEGFKECSKYRCQSLGQTCDFINAGTGQEACINNNPNDISFPIITKGDYISEGFNYTNVTGNGFSISTNEGGCIPEFSPVIYEIKTNEAAQCKYDIVHTNNYDEMQFFLSDTSLYMYNHTIALLLPSMDSLFNEIKGNMSEAEQANLASVLRQKTGDLNFFVRCIDKNGNANIKEFAIQTCVQPGDDLTPPYVSYSNPLSSSYLKFNENEKNLTIYVNEPSECKYSFNNVNYNEMNNSFICMNELEDVAMNGWPCYADVNGLTQIENNIYIKCLDQPWLENTENASKRNSMKQSAIVKLLSSKTELKIKNILPNSTMNVGEEPTTIEAEAETYGGANDKAACSYSFTGSNYIPFFSTYDKKHTQTFSFMMRGSYTLYLKCEDEAGNVAEASTGFIVNVDKTSPIVQRVYKNQNKLYLTTNEDAECFYSIKDCDYNIENASIMSGTSKEHTADWNPGGKYFVKCIDNYENEPLGCSIMIKADEVQNVA